MNYKQCILEKQIVPGVVQSTTSWIPEEYAKVGKKLSLKDRKTKKWDEGWEVKSVGTCRDEAYVLDHERDYLTQAEASDISDVPSSVGQAIKKMKM